MMLLYMKLVVSFYCMAVFIFFFTDTVLQVRDFVEQLTAVHDKHIDDKNKFYPETGKR